MNNLEVVTTVYGLAATTYSLKLKEKCGDLKQWERVGYNKTLSIYAQEKYGIYELPEQHLKFLRPEYKSCSCSHWIKDVFWIINKETKEIKPIGSECIKRFNIDGGLVKKCNNCGVFHNNQNRPSKNEKLKNHELLCSKCRKDEDYRNDNLTKYYKLKSVRHKQIFLNHGGTQFAGNYFAVGKQLINNLNDNYFFSEYMIR